ncbi:MAG TPA: ABC transporter permease [Gemmatimonadales bacterium]|jgi:putative ABC transport system permease protein
MTWRHAWRDLTRHRVRSALSLLGVAIAAALLLDMVMLSGGIEHSFGDLLLSRGFQLRLSPAGTLPFDTDASMAHADALLATVRADRRVAAAGAVLGVAAFAPHADSLVSLVVYGITPEAQGIYQLIRGHDLDPSDSDGVLISEPAATRLELGIGDRVTLSNGLDPRTGVAEVSRPLVVRGAARFSYDARDQPSVAVTLQTAQRLGGAALSDRASLLMVRITSDAAVDSVAASLRAQLPDVTVSSVAAMMVQFRERLSYFRQMSLILGSIALVVTVLLVTTLLTIGVNERRADIAALRAIGIARTTVLRQVMAQGVVLTVVGGAAGLVIGLGTARWLDAILTSFPGLPAAISFFVAGPRQLAIAATTLLMTGVLAGLVPAWRAASVPIAPTLRSEAA